MNEAGVELWRPPIVNQYSHHCQDLTRDLFLDIDEQISSDDSYIPPILMDEQDQSSKKMKKV